MIIYILVFIIGFVIGCMAYSDAIFIELRKCKTIQELVDMLVKLKLLSGKHNKKQKNNKQK